MLDEINGRVISQCVPSSFFFVDQTVLPVTTGVSGAVPEAQSGKETN